MEEQKQNKRLSEEVFDAFGVTGERGEKYKILMAEQTTFA